LRNEDLPTVT
jgi:hypothetical protein